MIQRQIESPQSSFFDVQSRRLGLNRLRTAWSQNLIPAWILHFAVAIAPLPFGSKSSIAIAAWCLLLGIGTALLSMGHLRPQQMWIVVGLLGIVAGYSFVLHEQLADRPWTAPYHPIWKMVADAIDPALRPSASIVRNQALYALGPTLVNLMVLLLGVAVGASRVRARQVLVVVAYSGGVYALYGIFSFLIEPNMILWQEKRAYLDSVTGTFINRNTAALYFGSCSVLLMLLLIEKVRQNFPNRHIVWRQLGPKQWRRLSWKDLAAPLLMLWVCLVAMFLTESRAGVGLSLLAIIMATTVCLRRELPRRTGIMLVPVLGVVVAALLLQALGGRVGNRFDVHGLDGEGRSAVWRATLKMIAEFPMFGEGLGTFAWAFPRFRTSDLPPAGIWEAAHSTPLEMAAELGLPLSFAVAAGWIMVLVILARGVAVRRRDRILPLAAFAIALLALLHSCIDFSLQIPGYAIPFFAIIGVGLSQSFSSRGTPAKMAVGAPIDGS